MNIKKILNSQGWHVNHKIMGIKRGCNCEIEQECLNKLAKILIKELKQKQK